MEVGYQREEMNRADYYHGRRGMALLRDTVSMTFEKDVELHFFEDVDDSGERCERHTGKIGKNCRKGYRVNGTW